MEYTHAFVSCRLCPRVCGVNRLIGTRGFCGETAQLRIAAIEAHFGEEPPISGTHGSGTVFFSGCSLKCAFCQNYQISHRQFGTEMQIQEVVTHLEKLYYTQGIHNVNFVTPDHFLPYTCAIVKSLREKQIAIPIVYNMSGYARIEALRMIEDSADIYLPDFKYADKALGAQLSHCQDYPAVALDAIAEMVRQKGFLDVFLEGTPHAVARQGVLIRHLILPGHVQNSIDALSMLFLEFGIDVPISLMSQYHPIGGWLPTEFQRRITPEEFQQVYDHAQSLGLQHLFVQYPEPQPDQTPEFLPDFTKEQPFHGNIRQASPSK